MASDKVNFGDVGSIAQVMKFQARSGEGWNDLSPQAREAIDQILSSIARTVASGQGAHWDGIMAYAELRQVSERTRSCGTEARRARQLRAPPGR